MSEVITISLEEYNRLIEAESFYNVVEGFAENLRAAGYDKKYGYIASENIPENFEIKELCNWLKKYFVFSSNTIVNCVELKKQEFSASSEKLDNKSKTESGNVDINEYKKELETVRAKIKEVSELHEEETKKAVQDINACTRYLEMLENLKKRADELEKKISSAQDNQNNTNEANSEEASSETSAEEAQHNDNLGEDCGNATVENEEEIKEEVKKAKENNKKYKKEKKDSDDKNRELLRKATGHSLEGNTVSPVAPEGMTNPVTGEECNGYVSAAEERTKNLINGEIQSLKDTYEKVAVFRDKDGTYFEVPAAVCPDVVLTDGEKVTETLNSHQILPEESEEEIERRKSHFTFRFSDAFYDIVFTDDNGVLLYSPLEHYGAVGHILGKRSVFVRSKISQNFANLLLSSFLRLSTSKSSLKKWVEENFDYNLSRQYLVEFLNSYVRVFHGLAIAIRKYILENSSTLHCDETPFLCLKISGCYIWVVVTGKHELRPGVIFFPGTSRKHQEFLKIFGIKELEDGTLSSDKNINIALKNLITDAHSSYPKGLEILKKYVKGMIHHSLCFVHVRREFLKALDAFGVLDEFSKAMKNAKAEKFDVALRNALVESKKENLQKIVFKIIKATYIINMILGLDADFICADASTIEERRSDFSKNLLDEFFEIIDNIYNDEKDKLQEINKYDGSKAYKTIMHFPYLKAVVYALNHREQLCAFLSDGDIETHNNIAESSVRMCVRQRNQMLFLINRIGYNAYCDLLTITATVDKLQINLPKYLSWALDCAKIYTFSSWCTNPSESAKSNCYIPKPYKDENGEIVNLYDDNFVCPFDSVPWDSILPWKYLDQLNKELEIYKNSSESSEKKQDSANFKAAEEIFGDDNDYRSYIYDICDQHVNNAQPAADQYHADEACFQPAEPSESAKSRVSSNNVQNQSNAVFSQPAKAEDCNSAENENKPIGKIPQSEESPAKICGCRHTADQGQPADAFPLFDEACDPPSTDQFRSADVPHQAVKSSAPQQGQEPLMDSLSQAPRASPSLLVSVANLCSRISGWVRHFFSR